MRVPLPQVREGCTLLIDKIRAHAQDARILWNVNRFPGAFLLILLGFEELGKLLECVQKGAEAERVDAQEIDILNYRDINTKSSHTRKASLSTEYIQRGLNLAGWALRATGIPDALLGKYADHISAIGKDYMRLRDTLMYVDYEHGTWTRGRPLDKESLENDIASLELVAAIVEAGLKGQPSFAAVVDSFTLLEHEMRQKLPDLIREVIARYAEWTKTKQP